MYKVLIVDDKSLIRKGIISSIHWEELNIEPVGEASNGQEALNIIKEVKPDIVLTDIRMPDMDGIELLKNICDLNSNIVTIVISGYDDFEYAKKVIKYGSIDYIMKPINRNELNESMKKACAILDKNKAYMPTNEQVLRDYFQKAIKGIKLNREEYKFQFEEYNLENCFFCIGIIKNKGNEPLQKEYSSSKENIRIFCIDKNNGIINLVLFANIKYISAQSFENEAYEIVKNIMKNYSVENTISGIGQVVSGIEDLENSYKTACDAAFQCILIKNEGTVLYSQIAIKKSLNIRVDEYESELIMNITSGNINKAIQILEWLFEKVLDSSDINIESIRLLLRNLCHILIKLNVEFEKDIYDFLDKISLPGYLLKYDSVFALYQSICNFYSFASKKYLDQSGGKNSIVEKVKTFIEKNYSQDISLKDLSALYHINPSYLTKIFKEEENYNINEFIIKVRVDNAKKILEAGKVNIQKLAETVGYENSTYFFRVFKKVTGMTPREYLLSKKKD